MESGILQLVYFLLLTDANVCLGSWQSPTWPRNKPWTLSGPYASGRSRPLWNGRSRRIKHLARSGPLRNARNALEVLAGAISWGFKSPSPHHRLRRT